MAPYIKVVVSLFFTGLGFWAFFGVLFKRFAALDQIKQDLETRLHND